MEGRRRSWEGRTANGRPYEEMVGERIATRRSARNDMEGRRRSWEGRTANGRPYEEMVGVRMVGGLEKKGERYGITARCRTLI